VPGVTPETARRSGGVYTQVWDGYSLAERDRRWSAVRAEAARHGFDCIFVPLGDGMNARYLTQFRASCVVLPTDRREPIAVTDRGSRNAWFPEPRLTTRQWAEPLAEALLDCGMERARIGVTGLRGGIFGHVRAREGVVNHSPFAYVQSRLPQASFEDATDVLGRVRYVKSGEEIACLRRAASIAAAGLDEVLPDLTEATLRARVLGRMLRLGSEYFPPELSASGIEISAVWGTQIAQAVQPFAEVSARLRDAFDRGLEYLRPGYSFGGLVDALGDAVRLQSLGAGDDGPLLTASSPGVVRELVIEPNTAFVWKPSMDGLSFGRPILITDQGVEQLIP
jgi:hypothetical protein